MITHRSDSEAQIAYRPETRHMEISFTGLPCSGMPPFSNELVALALGAVSVTFDFRDMSLTHPRSTVDSILSALGTDQTDPTVEILLMAPDHPGEPLDGCYYLG